MPSGLGPLVGLQKIVTALVNSGTSNIPNFQINQQIECSKYTIVVLYLREQQTIRLTSHLRKWMLLL